MAMGHNPNTLTSANSIILFRCKGLFDNWVKITGAQPDAWLSFSDVTLGETQVGVDGKQSGGFTPHETPVTLSLAANSESVDVLEFCYNDFIQNMEQRRCEFQITYTATNRKKSLDGFFVTKNGGGISRLLEGHTYNFNMMDSGFENI